MTARRKQEAVRRGLKASRSAMVRTFLGSDVRAACEAVARPVDGDVRRLDEPEVNRAGFAGGCLV